MQLKIACVQMDIAFGKPEVNRKKVEAQIRKLGQDTDLIVLPELWSTGYDLTRLEHIADWHGEETQHFFQQIARKQDVNIIGGSIAIQTTDGVTNTMMVINRKGELVGEYSKLHLFQLMDEHQYFQAGQSLGLFDLEGIPCAGSICYDIRFPEWICAHTARGAQVVFVVAEWPLPRLYHWRSLLISRAIENQCYIVACNRAGIDPKNVFAGHSMIIDPWGEIVGEAGEEETVLEARIDLEKVQEVRKQIPIFMDRRPEFYG